ncbi:uncharacterized protein LOC115622381 isoform X2 [Scaptodrosophila lebanonensis]|uniref:ubiquitinyl hydrolase 1 n=1 Tax=Drosophila lebanonensis TaxID=7225 RepID=A0A6J2T847_DROLE|nr:uncharacterized protein LOC115622381 isoform X2 [Scaptodrosophila lebanonensis]
MTIKPVSSVVDADKKEAHVGGQVVVEQSVVNPHRNVVIDGHGQSPQRRGEVYDELARSHRCSPHKSSRTKRREHHDSHAHHHKRDRLEREKLNLAAGVVSSVAGVTSKCSSPHAVPAPTVATSSSPSSVGRKSPEHKGLGCANAAKVQAQATPVPVGANLLKAVEDTFSGYNSGDEHLQPKDRATSAEEWQRRDEEFAKCMEQRGYELRPVEEDGACLFRSISLQIYGDEDMHDVIRQHTMDYIHENREYFGQFVTEDINSYIKRKRARDAHGNHIEIQAISEIYSRTVEVYCYQSTPINIFNSEQSQAGYPPLRLSYQRGSHYNAILDPYNATVGVGLGLAGYKPEFQTKEAVRMSEQLEIEQTMFEDKLKTTDWEATNEAIEEQIAPAGSATSSTVTSAEALTDSDASPSKYSGNKTGSNIVASVANDSGVVVGGSSTNLSASNNAAAGSLPSSRNFTLSPKTLSQFSHKLPPDVSELSGYDSDATDMSSTSSVGHCGGNASPTTATAQRAKTSKSQRRNGGIRSNKKRRHDREATPNGNAVKSVDLMETPLRKSPKRESAPATIGQQQQEQRSRSRTPDAEQQPCTSKQSHTPDKRNSGTTPSKQSRSSFYQELLEASYANDGFNENEMLQRAIQMSTQDYMEDQKRKYFFGP